MQHICKNCGQLYEGNYCNQCGQKAKTGRLTFRSVIDNWAYGLTNCDTGILFTYKELFTRPGYMLADYIKGKRVIYFQPFPMLFITAGLYGLLAQLFVPQTLSSPVITSSVTFLERFLHLLSSWFHSSMSVTAILSLPLFAYAAQITFPAARSPHIPTYWQFLSAWVYYWLIHTPANRMSLLSDYLFIATFTTRKKYIERKKYSYNFTEYIFIFAYIACQRLVVGLLFSLPVQAYTQSEKLTGLWSKLIYLIYFILLFCDFKQLFGLNFGKALQKTLIFLFSAMLLILLFACFIAGISIGILLLGEYLNLIPAESIEEIKTMLQ